MYIIENKLAFIDHPRMGSRAIGDAMIRRGGQKVGRQHQIDRPALDAVHQAGGVVCCTKRNMFEVLVSWFHFRPFDHEDFGTWLKSITNE